MANIEYDSRDEIQDDANNNDTFKSRKRKRNYDGSTKLEAIIWAKANSIHSAAKEFDVTRSQIRDWMKNEQAIREQM